MLVQSRPKSKRQCLNRAICYFKIVNIKQGEETAIFICYQTLFCQMQPDILMNLWLIWRTFWWAKYKKTSQNIRWYLAEKCLIIYLLCIFVNFNLKTVMPNVFCQQLETGLTSLIVKVVKLVFQNNHFNLFMTGLWIEILTLKAEDASRIVGC